MIRNNPKLYAEFKSNQRINCPICGNLVFKSEIGFIQSINKYGCKDCKRKYKTK